MRDLTTLGISPAPWKVQSFEERRWIVSNEARTICEVKHDLQIRQNTRIIAAAPELYEALRLCATRMCHDCRLAYDEPCENGCEYLKMAKAALAAASGESEVAK